MSGEVMALLRTRLPAAAAQVRDSRTGADDVEELDIAADALLAVARFLKTDRDAVYDLVDLAAVDRWPQTNARFVIVVMLVSNSHGGGVRLIVDVDDDSGMWPSLSSVWATASLYEREVMEFFGLTASAHKNPRPLLLPEGFIGFPGRLDYRLSKHQPQVPAPEQQPEVIVVEAGTNTDAS